MQKALIKATGELANITSSRTVSGSMVYTLTDMSGNKLLNGDSIFFNHLDIQKVASKEDIAKEHFSLEQSISEYLKDARQFGFEATGLPDMQAKLQRLANALNSLRLETILK